MERNANHIIQLYCHPPVGCRSLVDRCGFLGNSKPQIQFKVDMIGNWKRRWAEWVWSVSCCNIVLIWRATKNPEHWTVPWKPDIQVQHVSTKPTFLLRWCSQRVRWRLTFLTPNTGRHWNTGLFVTKLSFSLSRDESRSSYSVTSGIINGSIIKLMIGNILYNSLLTCVVLYWWGGHCCPVHCDLFAIYCAPRI